MVLNNTLRLYSSLFACCLLLFACSESHTLNPLAEDSVILAFGDSLTVGVGTSQQYSYPIVLGELTGRQVIASGVSGEETSQGLQRLPDVLDDTQPSLVVLLEGGNDILRNRNVRQIKDNLANMIQLIQARGVDVVLIGVPEKKLFSDVAPLYEELAEEYRLVLVRDELSSLLRKNEYKSDAVHLNKKGYRVLAETINDTLVKHGAL